MIKEYPVTDSIRVAARSNRLQLYWEENIRAPIMDPETAIIAGLVLIQAALHNVKDDVAAKTMIEKWVKEITPTL